MAINPNNTDDVFLWSFSAISIGSLTQIQNQTLMHNFFSFIFLFEILDCSRIWTLYSISLSFIFWKRLSSFFYFISLLMISKCIIDMYHNDIIYAVDSQNNKFIDFGIKMINCRNSPYIKGWIKIVFMKSILEKSALHEILQTYILN